MSTPTNLPGGTVTAARGEEGCDASLNDAAIIAAMTNTHTPERLHDEQLLALYAAAAKAEQITGWKLAAYRNESQPNGRHVRNDVRSLAEIAADMDVRREAYRAQYVGEQRMIDYCVGKCDEVEIAFEQAREASSAAYVAINTHEQSYTGWQRFWLVTSSAGLVHSGMNCSTCNKGRSATTFALLPTLSGQTVDVLVEAFGPVLCSVCFPAAPTEWVDGERIPARIAQVLLDEGVEAFEAERAKLAAKRDGAKGKLAAELAERGIVKATGPKIKLAEQLIEDGTATLVERGGVTSWKGRWTPHTIITLNKETQS